MSSTTGDFLVPTSQEHLDSSEPPRKRRRIIQVLPDSDDESDIIDSQDSVELPSTDNTDHIEIDDEILTNQHSRYEAFMHEPAFVESQKDVFVTQVEQPWSSPTRIRGPRWRKKTPTPSPSPETRTEQPNATENNSVVNVLIAEDFDDEEIEALMVSQDLGVNLNAIEEAKTHVPAAAHSQSTNMRQTTLFGTHTTSQKPQNRAPDSRSHNWPLSERNEQPTHHKLIEHAMKKWIFPLNVGTIRDYQYNIVHKALFSNVLVALPTGLGKTFIAATVMMNWYNWTKDAQIVFMAPTKPLVAQQVDACFNIAGIPKSQTTLMTGEIPSQVRADEWQTKRVFFMTPQTLINDLKSGIADPKKFVLLVVDEAHKATGNYSYVEVVRFLRRFNNSFRVLALTATPGASVEAVQKVIDGLDIARVEIRTEESLDIQAFVHDRNTELETFDFSEEISMCIDLFGKAVKPVVDKLCSQNAYWGKDPTSITLYGLMQARKQWTASDAGKRASWGIKGMINACFAPLLSLAHNLELLKYHGIGPFYHKMKGFEDGAAEGGKYAKSIVESEHFSTLMNRVKAWIQNEDFIGHPKLAHLNSVVLNHFMDAGNGLGRADGRPPSDTRIMIFAHYRDSAEEICRVLSRHKPMIRPHVFVGQSSTKGSEGMDQKKQTELIKQFKAGTYNTIVATSIGEEGLDIGEVDLIICYDCSKSPIRMLQRMGRTGRKRAGNIVMLLMKGKEERDYYMAKDSYRQMQETIESGKLFEYHNDRSPRIVPKGITPLVSKEVIAIPIENTQPGSIEPKRSKAKPKKKPAKKFHMPDGVETGFAFLGSKNKSKKPNKRDHTSRKLPKKLTLLDEGDASLPPNSKVLLTKQQESDLDKRYASIAGDEPQYIQLVQLSNHPDKLRSDDKIALVKHSTTTTRLLAATSLARTSDKYAQKPRLSAVDDANYNSPSESENQWDRREPEPLFYVSQKDPVPEASQDDGHGLSDLGDLLGRRVNITMAKTGHAATLRSRRNIVSDDDDD